MTKPPDGTPSQLPRVDLRVLLTLVGWPACSAVWFLAMGAVAIWGQTEIAQMFGIMGLFMGGVFGLLVMFMAHWRGKP